MSSETPSPPATSGAPPHWVGALTGLIAAACGLAAAELLVGFAASWRSPMVSVGDRVIDNTPAVVKDWAISTFGTGNKTVLLAGVALLLAAAAAGIGVWAMRRGPVVALVGVGGFTLVGILAAVGRGGGGIGAIVPSLLAGVVTAAAFLLLLRRGRPEGPAGPWAENRLALPDGFVPMDTSTRRRFLGTAAALGAGAVTAAAAGRWLQQRGIAATERLKMVLPRPASPLGSVPPAAELGVDGAAPFITPNADFFRIDTALTVPQVDPRDWTLSVIGDVENPLTLTYDELLARPMIEADITIACVSNEVGGSLVGTARWLGCRLDDLLEEAGVGPRADQIVGRSVDGFTAGFPTAVLDGRDAIVAVGMNGEPLPIRHGFPARLIVPGIYGYVSATKWLSEIELTRFDEFEGYWVPRGWSVEGPVKTQSRIDTPIRGRQVAAGELVPIAGVAWAPTKGIERVEVQIDDDPWRDATLGEQYVDTTWRQWMLEWTPAPGTHQLRVRATDGDGVTQTEQRTPVAPDGASGWHTVRIDAS